MKNSFSHLLALLISTVLFTGCIKDKFDTPELSQDPDIAVTNTINDLKTLYAASGKQLYSITTDMVISGVVTADDKSGNFYKELVIQDASGAIGIKLDKTGMYNEYPIGRRVYVKCKGLALGNYNKLVQLGGYIDSISTPGSPILAYIPSTTAPDYIVKGSSGNVVKADTVTIAQLNSSHQYKLIAIKEAEFQLSDTAYTLADAVNKVDANRTIKTCSGSSIIVRNSGYAEFAGLKPPKGNGTLTAVYTEFGSTKQLKIRDLNDVPFTSDRCGTNSQLVTITNLRALYTGAALPIVGKKVRGIVISDKDNGNINNRNIVIQDGNSGIMLRFDAAHGFILGDLIEVNINGASLEEYSGTLQVNNCLLANAVKVSSNNVLTPRIATVADINTNFEAWESTLVEVQSCNLTGGTTLSGSRTMNDGTGTITLYTTSAATFSGNPVPSTPVSITGIVSQFTTTKQIQLRNSSDIVP